VQWLALLNRAVFWFHPLAWWLERRLAALAEDTCDAAVLARGHDAQDYAEYLVDIARAVTRAGSRVKVVGTAMPGPRLARRIERLLNRASAPRVSHTRMVCTVAACAVSSAICAAATLEPASPQRAGGLSILTGPARAGARAEQILVTVNGEGLTNADFTQRHQELRETIGRSDASGHWLPAGSTRLNSGSNGRPEVLVDAVDDTLIVQRGKQLGYTFTDNQFKSLLDNIRKVYKIENDAELLARLKREHLTMADLRQNMERRMILARLRVNEIWAKSVFTEEEQRQYFEAHLNEFPLMQFEQARDLIDDHAVGRLQERKWAKYRSTLRSNAVIEWKRADLRRMYADGLAAPANALH
jgi:SurA N-terminal domain/BlaR1 peptidase M56